MEPRGLRNCNPGNIRITSDRWKGLRAQQTDKEFFQFREMKYGYRALLIVLRNYRKKHGLNSIADMIRRWAPSHENNTGAYITRVCQELQVPADYVPDVDDKETMCSLAAAISLIENGRPAIMGEITAGWDLI